MGELNFAFICDNNYVIPTVVAIYSLFDNCQIDKRKINIHIITYDISKQNIAYFNHIGEILNANIMIYDETSNIEYKNKLVQINQKSHVTPIALLKFEIPNILSESIETVLYLDSDIVIKGDISSIFNYDISDVALAACFEYWKCKMQLYEYSKIFCMPEFYFNSGVLLMNLNKWRDKNISDLLWKNKFNTINDFENKSFLMDQDVLNNILGKECIPLPFKYNCNPKFISNVHLEIFNSVYNTDYKNGKDIYEDAIIIHYVGKEDKPWIYYDGRCRKIWDKYYIRAGYKIDELKRKSNKANGIEILNKIASRVKTKGIIKTVKYIMDNLREGFDG